MRWGHSSIHDIPLSALSIDQLSCFSRWFLRRDYMAELSWLFNSLWWNGRFSCRVSCWHIGNFHLLLISWFLFIYDSLLTCEHLIPRSGSLQGFCCRVHGGFRQVWNSFIRQVGRGSVFLSLSWRTRRSSNSNGATRYQHSPQGLWTKPPIEKRSEGPARFVGFQSRELFLSTMDPSDDVDK